MTVLLKDKQFVILKMPHFSHNSFPSSKDKNGFCHTLSIDPLAVRRKPHSTTYKCMARSNGGCGDPRDGKIVLAKFSENRHGTSSETWAKQEVDRAKTAQMCADKFNHTISHLKMIKQNGCSSETGNRTVEFQIPQTSTLDSVSFLDGKRKKNETFIVIDNFSNFKKFICSRETSNGSSKKKKSSKSLKKSKSSYFSSLDNITSDGKRFRGRNRTCSEGDTGSVVRQDSSDHLFNYCQQCGHLEKLTTEPIPEFDHQHLQAFVHYFYCQMDGKMAIDCLEGEYDLSQGYTLSVPVIHSVDRRHGIHDRGLDGIYNVIQSHVCTHLCKHLPKMTMNPGSGVFQGEDGFLAPHQSVQPEEVHYQNISIRANSNNYIGGDVYSTDVNAQQRVNLCGIYFYSDPNDNIHTPQSIAYQVDR